MKEFMRMEQTNQISLRKERVQDRLIKIWDKITNTRIELIDIDQEIDDLLKLTHHQVKQKLEKCRLKQRAVEMRLGEFDQILIELKDEDKRVLDQMNELKAFAIRNEEDDYESVSDESMVNEFQRRQERKKEDRVLIRKNLKLSMEVKATTKVLDSNSETDSD